MMNMKKIIKTVLSLIKVSAAALAAVMCLTGTQAVSEAVYDAAMRCLTVVIPSLYGMLMVSGFLIRSGILCNAPEFLSRIGRFLFGMDGSVFPIFIFSLFAGYPVGAKMLAAEADAGRLSKNDASLFAGVCFGAGPAFIFGCVASRLYGSSAAGSCILISNISANIILAAALSLKMRKKNIIRQKTSLTLTADTLTRSILSAGRSMADICITVTAFAVLSALLRLCGAVENIAQAISRFSGLDQDTAEGVILSVLDVTAAGSMPENNYRLIPLLSALTAFGGICVMMQIAAVTKGRLSMRPVIFMRIAAALISGAVCRIIMPYMLSDEIITASAMSFSLHRSASPAPSVLLIIMTLLLFSEYDRISSSGKKSDRELS